MARQWRAPGVIEPAAFGNNGVEINQDEIFDFMGPPDAYFLLGGKVAYEHQKYNIEVGVNNLLNTSFRSYTDRLRYFSDAPGRNISLTLGVNF